MIRMMFGLSGPPHAKQTAENSDKRKRNQVFMKNKTGKGTRRRGPIFQGSGNEGTSRPRKLTPMKFLLLRLLLLLAPAAPALAAPPPGIVIHHSPAASGLYIGSPTICTLPDGAYLAAHDYFGPMSGEHERATGRLYRSADQGKSWQHVTDFSGWFWQNLFFHQGAVHAIGCDKHHGKLVIRRSKDGGTSWTDPVVLADGQWHTAPMPVLQHAGRLWRAIEDAHTGEKWGERYRARMMSIPQDADLLDPSAWTLSTALAGQSDWLDGDFAAWLEGNAVISPEGEMLNILRVDHTHLPEKAAIVRISADGTTATFDPARDFIEKPGGTKKFSIRADPGGPGYWSLATLVPDASPHERRPAGVRNTLALLHSVDLRHWEVRSILLHHPDVTRHGFQYVDWLFEGDDIIAVCRTAWGEGEAAARNNHDANYLTFHRWQNFRSLNRAQDAAQP
jgi:hypothetical protein